MEDYSYEKARNDTIIKWKWFTKNTDDNISYGKNYEKFLKENENLKKLNANCGFCEYFRDEDCNCNNCPMIIDSIICEHPIHPWLKYYNLATKKNAKKVLDLVLSIPEKEEDLIKKEN